MTSTREKERKSFIIFQNRIFDMEEKIRTIPVCFTADQLKLVEEYAKRRGMLDISQAIEELKLQNKN
jgi:hypothetical protein